MPRAIVRQPVAARARIASARRVQAAPQGKVGRRRVDLVDEQLRHRLVPTWGQVEAVRQVRMPLVVRRLLLHRTPQVEAWQRQLAGHGFCGGRVEPGVFQGLLEDTGGRV